MPKGEERECWCIKCIFKDDCCIRVECEVCKGEEPIEDCDEYAE